MFCNISYGYTIVMDESRGDRTKEVFTAHWLVFFRIPVYVAAST